MSSETKPSDSPHVEPIVEVSKPYPWKFITDEYIDSPQTEGAKLLTQLTNEEVTAADIFYEILLIVSEYSTRASCETLLQLLTEIISHYTKVEIRAKVSEEFILLASSFKSDPKLVSFIKNSPIDIRFKILHLSKSTLLTEKIFPEVGKYQYNDLRSRIFTVDSFSSLHEASEGYSKFISQIYSYLDLQIDELANVPALCKVLNRIIAQFNLDNNRCFLLLLNILSHYVDSNRNLVLEIFKHSPWWNESKYNLTIQTTLVDYLLNYVGIECTELKLITLLIKHDILDFDSIYNTLGPFDYSIIDSSSIKPIENTEIALLYEATKQETLKTSKLSTASALALAAPLLPDSDDEDERPASTSLQAATTETKVEEVKPKEVSILEKAKLFRKLKFLEYLLEFEMIDNVLFVLVQYPQIPLISDTIADLLNSLVDKNISPFYLEYVDNMNISMRVNHTLKTNESIESIDDFLKFIIRFISFNKYKLARNPSLLTKLIRIMKQSLDTNSKSTDFWLQFYRLNIFPCLSFTKNIPVVNEAFDTFLNYYSLQTRYNIYGEYQFNVKQDEITKLNYDIAEKKTRDLLKRLSIENVNISCRSLNKLCSINPIATSNAFISHIESYNSLIDLVCESSKFFNDFSWDVITFQLLNKLNSNRQVIQSDGLNYSLWFVNLSQFIGKLGKSYPESFQLYPILLGVVKSLKSGDFNILAVVKELLDLMTGIKPISNLTSKQIMKINAETSLKKIAYMAIQDNRESCTKSCSKLINTMVENNIFSEFFILLCHVSINLIDSADDKPLKFVNQKCDEVTSLIHNFTTALDSSLDIDSFKNNMIPIIELIRDYKIQPQWAFEVWRRNWSRDIKKNDNKSAVIFEPLKNELQETMSKLDWSLLNADFYLMFWQLSLYDINFNDLSYMMEYSDLKAQITGISMKLRQQKRLLTQKEICSMESKCELLVSILTRIREDMDVHENNFKLVMERLEDDKSSWFEESDKDVKDVELKERINQRSLAFLQSCALPRLQHSSFDAVFVSKFIFFFNQLRVPGYSLKCILDNIFMLNILPVTLYINTTAETENLALFYQLTLEKLHDWWSDKDIYAKESSKFDEDLDHADFCKLLFKWHENLLKQILKSLDSTSYTTRNNAILFLKVILVNFPSVEELADPLTDKLEDIVKNDGRDDITLASRALIGLIKFRQNKFISIWEFYEMEVEEKEAAVKAKEEKTIIEKARLEEVEKKRAEEEKKRLEEEKQAREKLHAEQAANSLTKPYGLVGLSAKKADDKAKTDDKKTNSKDSDEMDVNKPVEKKADIPTEPVKKTPPSSAPSVPAAKPAGEAKRTVNEIKKTDISNLPKSPSATSKAISQSSNAPSPQVPKLQLQHPRPTGPSPAASASNVRRDEQSNVGMNRSRNGSGSNMNESGSKWGKYNRNDPSPRYYEESSGRNGNNLIGGSPVTSVSERSSSNSGRNQYYSQQQQSQQQSQDRGGQYMQHSNSHSGYYGRNGGYRNHTQTPAPMPPPPTPPPPVSKNSNNKSNNNSNSNSGNNKRRMPPINDYTYKRSRRQ